MEETGLPNFTLTSSLMTSHWLSEKMTSFYANLELEQEVGSEENVAAVSEQHVAA
jgi:hypothetical protein